METGRTFVRVGVFATGDVAVRAAHTLAAHPGIEEVVVVGPASSKNFKVVADPEGCDLLLGTGDAALARARGFDMPLVWDGAAADGVSVCGASPLGLALAMADRLGSTAQSYLAHPSMDQGETRSVVFPSPVGRVLVDEIRFEGRIAFAGRTNTPVAACLAEGEGRRLAIVDEGPFMAGIALAAGAVLIQDEPLAVWNDSLAYLQTATEMGLVMAEESSGA